MGTVTTFQTWRQWPGARELTGADRAAVARAVRLGSQIHDPRLAPAVVDYAAMTRRVQERSGRFMWFVWLIAAVTLALAIADTLNKSLSTAGVWWMLVAFWIGMFLWLPRKRIRTLANASQAAAAARELAPDAAEDRSTAAMPRAASEPGPRLPRWTLALVILAAVLLFIASFGKPLLLVVVLVAIPIGLRWKRRIGGERAALVVIWAASILCVARLLIPGIALRTVAIRSAAMEPTIGKHERVMFDRLDRFGVGDIVAFRAPHDAHQRLCGPSPHRIAPGGGACTAAERQHKRGFYIRRVVAGPGDVISIIDGEVIRNGIPERARYVTSCHESDCSFPTPIRIPRGVWFLMSDNRRESDDSRFFGPIPDSWILGPAIMRTWPPGRVGAL